MRISTEIPHFSFLVSRSWGDCFMRAIRESPLHTRRGCLQTVGAHHDAPANRSRCANYEQIVNIALLRIIFPLHIAYFGVYLTYRVSLGLYRSIFDYRMRFFGDFSPMPFVITI